MMGRPRCAARSAQKVTASNGVGRVRAASLASHCRRIALRFMPVPFRKVAFGASVCVLRSFATPGCGALKFPPVLDEHRQVAEALLGEIGRAQGDMMHR